MKCSSFLLYPLLLTTTLLIGCGGSTNATEDDNTSTETASNSTSNNMTSDESTEENTSNDTDGSSEGSSEIEYTEKSSELVINEVVADAIDGGNDWIELYVVTGTVSLSDYSIVDDNSEHVAQVLPDVILNEGDFFVIQAIDDEDTPPDDGYYVSFKLGSDDAVTLFKAGEQIDQLDWQDTDALEGSSYGLFTDGINNAITLSPTPGAANQEVLSSDNEVATLDIVTNENVALRINEIVAKNNSSTYDWIELYVTGDSSVNLSDYSIADDNNELFSLPNISIEPGTFYLIAASTDAIDNIATVNFKLGASDQVRLFQGDDLIDQLDWNKGQALYGFSYGRFPDGSDSTKTLVPSPESGNELALHGPLVLNEILADDINGQDDWFELYNNSTETIALVDYQVIDESDDIDPVSLPNVDLAPGEYLVIYANGSDEGDNSVPFKLGKTDELSLMLNNETVDYVDWDDSDVTAGFSYGLSDVTELSNSWEYDFLTPSQGNANQIYSAFNANEVKRLAITISDENWQNILNNPLDEEYHQASITFDGVTLNSVAIRTKGGSSLNSVANSTSDRYSFKLDINEYVSGQKFFGLKKFTLQNSFNDPSYMREVIAYDLLDEMGVATPEYAYVNFYVNDELFGFYLMVEAIDGEFLENHFANANGDLYKPDGTGSDLTWIDNDIASYSDINLQTNEETTDGGAFLNFVAALAEGANEVIDVDGLLRYMSVSVALSNLDSYHGTLAHNYYLYEQDGVFSLLPWDFNESFGTFAMNCNGVDVRELYIDEPTSGALDERPMVGNVFVNDEHLATYHTYLQQLIEGPLQSSSFSARIDEIAALISEHVANDPSAFYSHSNFLQNLNSTVDRFYGLTEFIQYRVNNISQQLNGDLPSNGDGSGFCGNSVSTPRR